LLRIFAIILGTRIVLQFPAVFYEKAVRERAGERGYKWSSYFVKD